MKVARLCFSWVAFGLALGSLAHGQDAAFLVTFDHARLGHNARCDGRVVARGCELVGVEPVLFEARDTAEGAAWKCIVQGTKEAPGKRGVTNQMKRRKGLVVAVSGSGVVRLETAVGKDQWHTSDVPFGASSPLLDGRASVQRVPGARRLSGGESEDEFPAVACDTSGRVWAAWQSWDGEADRLLWARREGGGWSDPAPVVDRTGDFFRVRLAPDGAGGVSAVWAEQREGNWDLWARRLPGKSGAEPLRLTTEPGTDFNHVLAAGPDGTTWLAWQSERDGQYDLFLAKLEAGGLGEVVQVTDSSANDWEPALAVQESGSVAIAWDTYRNGSYDIYLRRYADGQLSVPVPVACTPAYEAHATVACDSQGRFWIAWDNGGPNWGKHGKPRPLLHRTRKVEVCCLEGDRRLVPDAPASTCLPPRLRGLWELPQIAVDRWDRPVLLFRQLSRIRRWNVRRKRREHQSRGIWAYFASVYDGNRWTEPMLLHGSEGRNDQRADLARGPDGTLWMAWAGDGRNRTRAEIPGNNNVFAAPLPAFGEPDGPIALTPVEQSPKPRDLREPRCTRPQMTVGGQNYLLLYGDTHRHTDISRCNMNHDGSLLDTYRYAIDAAGLDFLAISDHDQDILKHRYDHKDRPLEGYMWWRSEKLCDLFHMTDGFIALYGYEHGGSMRRRGGHKNVIYATRGNPCIEKDAPPELFAALEGRNAVAIPHQLADGGSATDWSQWNGRFEPVAEVFQARGSYEFQGCPREVRVKRPGHYYWDALAKGVKIGAIASSDHGLTHGAYAGCYVKEATREGVLESLRARRTFGATDTIVLDFRLGDHAMGQEVTVTSAPKLEAQVRATGGIKRVDIVRDGTFAYTAHPKDTTHRVAYTDMDLKPGQSAYYMLRCVQADDELAWSSPIWVSWEK